MKYKCLLPLALFLIFSTAKAQKDTIGKQKKISITPLPVLINDPFIGFGYGAIVNTNFLMGEAATTRYSNAQAFVMKTTRGQLQMQLNHILFLNNEDWMIQGKFQYLNFPEFTYGLGGNTSADTPSKERVSYKAFEFEERVMRRIGNKNFIGLQFRLYDCWNLSSDIIPQRSFFDSAAVGNKSFIALGIGVHFIHDSRDNVQNAYRGHYLEVAVNPFPKFLGSTQNWTNIRIDARNYVMLNTDESHAHVLASRILYEQAVGDPPFMLTPMTGRYFSTRGYVQGRYRGKQFFTAESEYRAPLWRFIGYVAFVNIQSVSQPNGGFQYIRPGGGGGLRFMLTKAQRTNLRVDYATGVKGNSGLYLQVTEVF